MVEHMSRQEEQRGRSKAVIWGLAAIGLIAVIAIAGPLLTDYFVVPDNAGMEEMTKTPSEIGDEASAPPADVAAIGIKEGTDYGAYLTDGEGRALYLFEGDEQGQGDQAAVSTCYEDCAKAWPPLTTSEMPRTVGGVDEQLLATIERRDGTKQVAYNGWPLYHFAKDFGPNEATGQDVEDFGAEWYLVTPAGEKADQAAEGTG